MRLRERPIAITDIETTGLDASVHEIVDLALLVVDPQSLKIRDEYHARIKPLNIRTGARRALDVIGYSSRAWANAVDLETALTVYAQKAADAVFCSYNVFLTYSFLDAGFKSAGVEDPTDYHRLDLFTLAWSRLGMASPSFDQICRKLDVAPEPKPHRASIGAAKQLAVLRALLYR
ncbi:MAG TPA: exonuclease domain-containing protein [Candidatus Paceibacterota bacterium]|nr:exonuclease domain-containing protein [Candidatus Paceibacterota bacterium]